MSKVEIKYRLVLEVAIDKILVELAHSNNFQMVAIAEAEEVGLEENSNTQATEGICNECFFLCKRGI